MINYYIGSKKFLWALAIICIEIFVPISLAFATDNPPTILTPNVFSFQNTTPKVDGTSGALVLSLPIDIPPGRNGLQPDLTLDYNSQNTAQDSIVGYGWTLSIPYIQRLNKTGSQDLYGSNPYTITNKPFHTVSVSNHSPIIASSCRDHQPTH